MFYCRTSMFHIMTIYSSYIVDLRPKDARKVPIWPPRFGLIKVPFWSCCNFKWIPFSFGVIGRLCRHLSCRDTWTRCAGRPERSRPPVHTTAAAPRPTPNIHLAHFFTSSRSVWNKNMADIRRAFALVKFYAEMPFSM